MSLTVAQKLNLQGAFAAAHDCAPETECPEALSVAQWALESGWGSRSPEHNCFGIKEYPHCYGVQMIDTWEVIHGERRKQRLAFAMFPTLAACFVKHAQLITHGEKYARAWDAYRMDHDVDSLIRGVAKVYATDPDYGDKLHAIIRMPEVQAVLNGVAA